MSCRHIASRITQVFVANFRHAPAPQRLEIFRGAVAVADNGRIVRVVRADLNAFLKQLSPQVQIHDYRKEPQAFDPGRVDVHLHGPQFRNRYRFGRQADEELELLPWLKQLTFPEELRFASVRHAQNVYQKLLTELLRHGTTHALMYGTIHGEGTAELFQAVWQAGLHAFIGNVHMEQNADDACKLELPVEASLEISAELYERYHQKADRRLRLVIIPRFLPCVPPSSLDRLALFADERGLLKTSHISENPGEVAWVQELYPHQGTYTQIYADHGFLDARTIQAHAIYLDEKELKLIADSGAKIAHCPGSNTWLNSGVMPLTHYLDRGLSVGLGSDISGGSDISMPLVGRQAREAAKLYAALGRQWKRSEQAESRPLTPAEALYLQTLGGATCLGIEAETGSFEVGKFFNAIRIDFSKGNLQLVSDGDIESNFQRFDLAGDSRNVAAVYVNGQNVNLDPFGLVGV